MPIVMLFDPVTHRLLTTASGEVTLAELLEHIAAEGREVISAPRSCSTRVRRQRISPRRRSGI